MLNFIISHDFAVTVLISIWKPDQNLYYDQSPQHFKSFEPLRGLFLWARLFQQFLNFNKINKNVESQIIYHVFWGATKFLRNIKSSYHLKRIFQKTAYMQDPPFSSFTCIVSAHIYKNNSRRSLSQKLSLTRRNKSRAKFRRSYYITEFIVQKPPGELFWDFQHISYHREKEILLSKALLNVGFITRNIYSKLVTSFKW